MVRGDSHFATSEVMDLLEENRCGYIFGLSTNTRLIEIGRPWSEDVATRRALSKTQKMRRFFQTSYAAASWSKPRKVVARVEASEQGSDAREDEVDDGADVLDRVSPRTIGRLALGSSDISFGRLDLP